MEVTYTDHKFNMKVMRDQMLFGLGIFGSFVASLYAGLPLFIAAKDPTKKLHYHEKEREKVVEDILKLREELGRINIVATEVLKARGPVEEGYYNDAYEKLPEPHERYKM
ncbi:hypothetical protein HY969_05085 [Candidatus Kaiserbacteria bacterium]|nr:hypothetical protein [Candidatus Kaiserbacteria bacterium]